MVWNLSCELLFFLSKYQTHRLCALFLLRSHHYQLHLFLRRFVVKLKRTKKVSKMNRLHFHHHRHYSDPCNLHRWAAWTVTRPRKAKGSSPAMWQAILHLFPALPLKYVDPFYLYMLIITPRAMANLSSAHRCRLSVSLSHKSPSYPYRPCTRPYHQQRLLSPL